MLETDEVDDDFFAPAPNTTLAHIFGGPSCEDKDIQNESLKYTPPKKQDVDMPLRTGVKPDDETKVTDCVLACALTAYEWDLNKYSSRGKLGFAIIKMIKSNCHNIVLYNSNKTTLSSVAVSPKLNMTLKGNSYLSYYDSINKYWSVYGKEEEIDKIVTILKSLEVDIKHASSTDQTPLEPILKSENEPVMLKLSDKKEEMEEVKESDTDSSVNRRTKASILNRMANMGHSVLPTSASLGLVISSDSSDTNENVNQPPKIRPKPNKINTKRLTIDKKVSDLPDTVEGSKMSVAKIEQPFVSSTSSLYTIMNGQLVPVLNTNALNAGATNSNSDINLFITEQRVNSSELRININRTTDKVDQILDKIKSLEHSSGDKYSSSIQMEIMQKLLVEYESKIKHYEQILETQDEKSSKIKTFENFTSLSHDSPKSYEQQILELKNIIQDKENEILKINEKLEESKLVREIRDLKEILTLKSVQLEKLSKEISEFREQKTASRTEDLENKLKIVMNNVFQNMSVNLEDSETYTGEHLKKLLAIVIKKCTVESLSH